MERTRLNKRDGIIHLVADRGFFAYPDKGQKGQGKPWHYIRLIDLTVSRGEERRPVYRRRKITEFDSKKRLGSHPYGSVTSHIDLLVEQIPEVCHALMELYQQEMGITKREADAVLEKKKEEDMDEIDIKLKKLGGAVS